jgi:chromosome segregation ATPase
LARWDLLADMPEDAETFTVQQLRAMEQPSWSEGRLDDLNNKVDAGIGRLDEERKELRGEMKEGFAQVCRRFEKVDERFDKVDQRFDKVDEEFKAVRSEMKEGFDRVDERFDRMQRTLIVGASGIIAALITAPHL